MTDIQISHPNPPLDELMHYGVKGMKWGVRKDRARSSKSGSKTDTPKTRMTPEQKKRRAKQIAIGVGVLTVAAGAGYAAYKLKKDGKLDVSMMRKGAKKVSEAKEAVEKIIETPTEIALGTRGHSKGYVFLRSGQMQEPFHAFAKAGLVTAENEVKPNTIRKVDTGEVAAVLLDPKGRKDHAGRTIPHSILIPKAMASGIETIADVREKIWPQIADEYEAFYEDDDQLQWLRSRGHA